TVNESAILPTFKGSPLKPMTSEDWEEVASGDQGVRAEKMAGLDLEINDSLPDSDGEDDLHIAPVMSSLFDDEDDDEREDFTAKILETKDDGPPTIESPRPKSPMVEPALLIATPSVTVVAEENIGSSKPAMAEDKGKGPAEIEEAKKAIEEDTPPGEGPFDQEHGGR
ncbi:hypothetical protein ACJX0J_041487, partial [Zea mays]